MTLQLAPGIPADMHRPPSGACRCVLLALYTVVVFSGTVGGTCLSATSPLGASPLIILALRSHLQAPCLSGASTGMRTSRTGSTRASTRSSTGATWAPPPQTSQVRKQQCFDVWCGVNWTLLLFLCYVMQLEYCSLIFFGFPFPCHSAP